MLYILVRSGQFVEFLHNSIFVTSKVRTTIKEENKGKSGTHAFFVTNVNVYGNPTKEQTLPLTLRGNTDLDRILDTKLQQFCEYENQGSIGFKN